MIKHDWQTTALAGLLLAVATLAYLGLDSLIGEAAEPVLGALAGLGAVGAALRDRAKRQ